MGGAAAALVAEGSAGQIRGAPGGGVVREPSSQGARGNKLNQWPPLSVSTLKSWSLGSSKGCWDCCGPPGQAPASSGGRTSRDGAAGVRAGGTPGLLGKGGCCWSREASGGEGAVIVVERPCRQPLGSTE